MSRGLIVDLFCGGGGTSVGIRRAIGRDPDVAVNHDEQAVAMHVANHPATRHLHGNVWSYRPRDVVGTVDVDLLWCSPTCTYFSRAKGGPLDRKAATKIRALAWVAVRWAKDVRPRVIALENVEPFRFWGPLLNDGKPCPRRRGFTFRRWVREFERLGYAVEWRELRACDYGAPTSRNRLFLIARCDGLPIVWPEPTHGRGRLPYRTAAECIDFSLPCPSIFGRSKPLSEATLRRIARGIRKFVLETADPFVVGNIAPVLMKNMTNNVGQRVDAPLSTILTGNHHFLVAPTLVQQSYGEREGQSPRALDIRMPLGTVVAGGVKHAVVAAFLAKHFGGHETPGQSLQLPLGTVTCRDHHALVMARTDGDRREQVRAFLTQYNSASIGQSLQLPLNTVTTRDRFGLVTVLGESFEIADIGMRLLEPRELFNAQGFDPSYVIAPTFNGRPLTKTAQVRMAGNSVAPDVAAAIVSANLGQREVVAA